MSIEERRYDHLWGQLCFHQSGTRAAFSFFAQLATAIVGGSIWLSLNAALTPYAAARFALLSDLLVAGIALLTCFKIREHMRAWWSNRAFIALLHHENDPPLADPGPSRRSQYYDMALMAAILMTAVAFIAINPFMVSRQALTRAATPLAAPQPERH